MDTLEKVLIVDDDPNVLKAYERRLRKQFEIETALCSEEGVTAANILGPFAVVVSDMMMPRENGARFLERMLEEAPDSVRIMLTGNADQATAAAAINQGRVFRFLNKPCEAEELSAAIGQAIEEHKRRVQEKRVVRETVLGAVEMLAKLLVAANPQAFGRAERLRAFVSSLAARLKVRDPWELATAAFLSQLAWVAIPAEASDQAPEGGAESKQARALIESRYEFASELIDEAPRLHQVSSMVRLAGKAPGSAPAEEDPSVLLGAELIRMAETYDDLTVAQGLHPAVALERLEYDSATADSAALDAVREHVKKCAERELVSVGVQQLSDGMLLAEDVVTTDGALLVAKGLEVTPTLRARLTKYCQTHDIQQPLQALAKPDA